MNHVKPNPTFIRRIYNSNPWNPIRIDVFAYPKVAETDVPVVEFSLHGSDSRHVTAHLTQEDGEALIEAIRKAIDVAKVEAAE